MDKRTGRDQWINARMRKLLAEDFCPTCGKHKVLHDDKKCTMRFVKEDHETSEVDSRLLCVSR
jgi:hypothetical protein